MPWRQSFSCALLDARKESGAADHRCLGAWGYPHWFHFVTGSLELMTAILLARARTRLWGSALACAVMLAALATVTVHSEYGHGVAPLVVATLSIVVGWIAWRKRLDVGPMARA
ncbi:DoxX family protein [Paraburkholderia sp. A1RI-2L]|uniref:DoxX family protein n=1 Tax=Paraburkholderia sp. A1RI-2L TaxID=3028367 RepID=UPI003BA16DFE